MDIGTSAIVVLLMAAAVQGQDVKIEKDVAYLPAGRAEKLDLYLPAQDPSRERSGRAL